MTATKARQQHIAKVEAEIARLSAAVQMLKANTADLPTWEWNGDWQHLAQTMNEVTDSAESMARQSQHE